MKQHTFNWLCYSVILLLVSCKKKTQRIFDDFPPGKFGFVWFRDQNGIKDTMKGEVSGPYPVGGNQHFRKQLVLGEDEFSFRLSGNGVTLYKLKVDETNFMVDIESYQVTADNLSISFESVDTIVGTLNLTRK